MSIIDGGLWESLVIGHTPTDPIGPPFAMVAQEGHMLQQSTPLNFLESDWLLCVTGLLCFTVIPFNLEFYSRVIFYNVGLRL